MTPENKLPEWIQDIQNSYGQKSVIHNQRKVIEALAIALESLADIKTIQPHDSNHVPPRLCSNCLATEAMKRIGELSSAK